MKEVIIYEADDGQRFDYESQCVKYEEMCKRVEEANDLLNRGYPLYVIWKFIYPNDNSSFSEKEIDLLMKINKDTKFIVSYWQCKDIPGYKVCKINNDGYLWLFGDVGSWSGPYGNWITISELLRYAEHPKTIFS